MILADWIGFVGVFMILLAYFLNVSGRLGSGNRAFLWLNILGAGLACLASVLISYWPFIILEGMWAMVSLAALLKKVPDR